MPDYKVIQSTCTECEAKVADKDCLTCNTCENHFHAACPSAPDKESQFCTKTFLGQFQSTLNSKPNFSWQCNACKTESEVNNVATLRNMLTRMENSHTTQINNLTALVNTLMDKFNSITTSDQPGAGTVWADKNGLETVKIRSSFVAKPDELGNKIQPRVVRKIATDNGIPVHSVVEAPNGDLFVNLPDEKSRDDISQLVGQGHDGEVVKLEAKLPTISINDITARDMKDDEDKDLTKDQIKLDICNQNKVIENLVNSGCTLDIVYCRPPPVNKKFYTVVARVSPKIRDVLDKMKMKIYFGTSVHRVSDRFHVRRCNLCQAYGHFAEKCSPATPIVCGYCTGSHKSEECVEKGKDHTHHKCNNCVVSKLAAAGHSAFWQKCPSYIVAQNKLAKTISYDYKLN